MGADSMNTADRSKDRHVLIALNDSENAERALLYTGDFLGGVPGFRATLLRVVPQPPEDCFGSEEERKTWIDQERSKAEQALDRYRQLLVQSGFSEDKVDTLIDIRTCPSIADCILDKQRELDCCTIVVGRRGISKKEEFIFGSTSNKLLHKGKNCAVWVIE